MKNKKARYLINSIARFVSSNVSSNIYFFIWWYDVDVKSLVISEDGYVNSSYVKQKWEI